MADPKISATDTESEEPQLDEKEKIEEVSEEEGSESTDTEKEEKEEVEVEEKVDPVPVRSSAQHIIARQKRTIEKLRSKTEEPVVETEEEETDVDDDTTLTPEVAAAIDRKLKKRLEPVLGTLASKADEDELAALFSQEPEAKKYEKRIRAHMEVWKNVPVANIYHSLAFKSAQAIGSKKKKVADTEAEQMRTAGSQRRGQAKASRLPTAEEIEDMDDTEFEALQNKVRNGAYRK